MSNGKPGRAVLTTATAGHNGKGGAPSLPVWRCERCSNWEARNGEARMVCRFCWSSGNSKHRGGHRIVMVPAMRAEPAPDATWGTWAEDL